MRKDYEELEMEAIANRMRLLRKAKKIPQVDIVAKKGESKTYIFMLETHKRPPNVRSVYAYAKAVGVSARYLLSATSRDLESDTLICEAVRSFSSNGNEDKETILWFLYHAAGIKESTILYTFEPLKEPAMKDWTLLKFLQEKSPEEKQKLMCILKPVNESVNLEPFVKVESYGTAEEVSRYLDSDMVLNKMIETRKKMKVSQKELGKFCGRNSAVLCHIEKKVRGINLRTLHAYALYLGVTEDYFLGIYPSSFSWSNILDDMLIQLLSLYNNEEKKELIVFLNKMSQLDINIISLIRLYSDKEIDDILHVFEITRRRSAKI